MLKRVQSCLHVILMVVAANCGLHRGEPEWKAYCTVATNCGPTSVKQRKPAFIDPVAADRSFDRSRYVRSGGNQYWAADAVAR
jgi:hypothetical protein